MTTLDSATDRYDGLRKYLAGLPLDRYNVELKFSRIEKLIGGPLPPEASDSAWWRIDGGSPSPQSRAWGDAGFGIGAIAGLPDRSGWVSFVRGLHRWPDVGVSSWEFGQLSVVERLRQLAIGYLESGKLLCIYLGENPSELTWPRGAVVCFCYRHAVELFVKSCILHREPVEKCDHNISGLRKQYLRLYPQEEFSFRTLYDLSLQEVEELLGGQFEVEEFERKEDQVYRYFSDKQGRSPKATHTFGPGDWLSMLEDLERQMTRIWACIREMDSRA
jgi:hypothetical protein